MKAALWVIAICEAVRAVQSVIYTVAASSDKADRKNVYQEFVKSLKRSDREFVKGLLKEFDEQEGAEDGN